MQEPIETEIVIPELQPNDKEYEYESGEEEERIYVDSGDEGDNNNTWLRIGPVDLKCHEKSILQSDDMWLNDKHINAAQYFLHQQFPLIQGFQDTVLQKRNGFSVESGEFIQIINMAESHWVTLSTLGLQQHGTIRMYGSMKAKGISSEVQQIIASLLCTTKPIVTVKKEHVQQQPDSSNCGPFAIAFATHESFGQDPRRAVFDVAGMRTHLLQCFEAKKISPFPTLEICTTIHLSELEVFRVYCCCRMPLTQEDELQTCNVCSERFHAACQLNAEKHWMDQGDDTKVWFCNECWKLVEKKGFVITGIKEQH